MTTSTAPHALPTTDEARDAVHAVAAAMKLATLERSDHVDAIITVAVAGHHASLVGAPGVAKSMLARCLSTAFADARWFEYMMTRGTETSEVFGAKNIDAMKRGEAVRNLTGTIADAEVAFLDEAFKGHSSILNAMLGVLNERVFHNGSAGAVAVPLRFLLAASNEVPDEDDASLGAFYDRFLVRLHVVELVDDDAFAALVRRQLAPMQAGIATIAHLDVAREAARSLPLSDGAVKALRAVVLACRQAGIAVSDRRAVWIADFLRARAWLDGHVEVDASSVSSIVDTLWSRPEQRARAEEIVKQHAPSWESDARDIRRVLGEQRAAIGAATKLKTVQLVTAALQPIASILKDLDGDIAAKVATPSPVAARTLSREVQAVRDELSAAIGEAYRR